MIESGPIPAVHGVVRWQLIDLAQWIFEEFRITIAKQTLSRELRAMGYRKLSARPRHHAQASASSCAAEVPRAQPGRERLAVHARQLALQPHLQILRRSRRPLLCGMEQARRSALAHHVHRTAPMGPRVLINGIWYNAADYAGFAIDSTSAAT